MQSRAKKWFIIGAALLGLLVVGLVIKYGRASNKPSDRNTVHAQPKNSRQLEKKSVKTTRSTKPSNPCVVPASQPEPSTHPQTESRWSIDPTDRAGHSVLFPEPNPPMPAVIRIVIAVSTERIPDPGFQFVQPQTERGKPNTRPGWKTFRRDQTGN